MTHRSRVGSAVAAALAVSSGLVVAQEQPAGEEVLAEVTVTGSRIVRTGMSTPTPVTAVTADELQNLAPGTMMDALDELPQFVNSSTVETSGSWTTVGGQSVLNLRGIGSNRTLVLLNGRRVTPTNRLSTVDISLFPQALIQRVDVVTGGASAAYGSDAVSGVVNFILDTRYTGLDVQVQGGMTSRGDNENVGVQLAGGHALGDNMHLIFGADYYNAEEISNYHDRGWYEGWSTLSMPAGSTPARLRRAGVHASDATYGGLITGSGPLAGLEFLADGSAAPFVRGELTNSNRSLQVGGSGANYAYDDLVLPASWRGSVYGNLQFDLGDNTDGFLQAFWGKSSVDNDKVGYNILGSWAATIYSGNPFLPQSIQERMTNENIASFQFSKNPSPDDPLNNARAPLTSTSFSVTTGLNGRLSDRWGYSAYVQYGESERYLELYGFRVDRLYKGLDAVTHPDTGEIVCRSTLSFPDDGCVPLNLFGIGNASAEALDWIHDSGWLRTDVSQFFTEASVSGALFDNWAGPVSLAAGVSYRKDKLDQVGGDPGGSPVPSPPDGPVRPAAEEGYRGLPAVYVGYGYIDRAGFVSLAGSFDVVEGFTEVLVPVARDLPIAKAADVTLAARYADYQGSGAIWAWKAGLDWSLTDALRLRLTRSRDVRAGSLAERFDVTLTGANITDPFLPGNPQYQVRTVFGGNPEVDPEKADTITFGAIYQPTWLQGLAVSADFYDIKIKGAISQLGNQPIVDQCFAGATQLCDLIVRNSESGVIDNIFNTYINVAEARTRGVDMEISYGRPITLFGGGERLRIRAFGTYTDEASSTQLGAEKVDRANQTGVGGGVPRWSANVGLTYSRGPFSLNWQQRYIGSGKWDSTWVEGIDVDDNTVAAAFYTNLRASYDFESGPGKWSVYGSVTNLFDKHPSEGATTSLFSAVGRAFVVGINLKL